MAVRSVSIIVPTHNRAGVLGTTLQTISALQVPPSVTVLDVLVVDNRSTDGTAAAVAECAELSPFPVRRVVEEKLGASHARNHGIKESSGDWLIYLDDDIKVSPEWLYGLAEAVRLFNADVVTGPVFPWFEGEVPSWCTAARVLDCVTSAYSRRGDQTFILPAGQAHELPGCNFAVKRALAIELGGFHPALDRAGKGMLAGGDFEFGMRLADRGACAVYVPRCRIEHFISQKKMSKAGLKQRWRGLGATANAIQNIRAEPIALRRRCRLLLRLHRLRWRAKRMAAHSPDAALRWELEALRLRALLFSRVVGFTGGR